MNNDIDVCEKPKIYKHIDASIAEANDGKHALYVTARNITVSFDTHQNARASNLTTPCPDEQQPSCSHWSSPRRTNGGKYKNQLN